MLDKRASITVVGFLRVVCFGYHFLLFARSWCAFQFTTNFCAIISSDCRPNRKCLLDYKLQAIRHLHAPSARITSAVMAWTRQNLFSLWAWEHFEVALISCQSCRLTNGKEQEEGAKEGAARPKQNCQVS
ncbi:hypothetical protein KCU87_g401, partial [Aureobasidium melanogenum]